MGLHTLQNGGGKNLMIGLKVTIMNVHYQKNASM